MSNARLPDRLGPKRLKIAIACDCCRTSKKKCDGARPACNQCQRKRTPCSYRNDSVGTDGANATVTASSSFRHAPPERQVTRPGRALSPDAEPPEPDGAQPAEPPSGVVHGVFAREVKAALDAKLGIPSAGRKAINLTPMKDAPLFDLRLGAQPGDNIESSSVLPHRRHADRLVDLFWKHIQPVEPILEPALFNRTYDALFAGRPLPNGADERIFLSILNAVFALSTQLHESLPADERNQVGNTYFRRAWALLRVEAVLWEPGSVEVVQCLLLMARYLQCSSHLHQTWMAVGIAVRTAQSIGLDRPNSSSGDSLALVPRHFREQLWQCCVYIDRMVSWMMGRTPMILLHGLSHDAAAGEGNPQSGDQTAGYLTKTMELYEISNHISLSHLPLRSSLPEKLGLPPLYRFEDHFSNVSRYDACLDRWAESLPRSLRYNHIDGRVHPISYKQALLLQLRFHHGRVTLFRPMLARHCLSRIPTSQSDNTTDRSGSLSHRIVQDCAALCVENAQKVIALIVDECNTSPQSDGSGGGAAAGADAGLNSGSGSGIIPWWYRVFYLHVAGTVLMAATLQPNLCTPDVSESWSRAMAALRAHEHLSPFVSQCVATFETLSSGMSAHQQPPYGHPVMDEGVSNVNNVSVPPLQDVFFQDMAFETEALFFGMEDTSWMGNLSLPL
ncbi:fungal-specific transcription factor domain-containing protein [Chaetomium fimeti]|uniref:Fungal-specific transcription factor domain-containing protein n=1 Tax=Chaetomium fimeti TaxID=1854472 RepID=A0AAE0LUF5_9PEZI|nr:fungal-specific transcription factor domain-containing protein [Chaetomium fimeti]